MGQQTSTTTATSENPDQGQEAVWWCRILSRILGTVAGLFCCFFGIWTCISTSPICIVAGLLQIIVGLIVLIFEAPICFTFLEVTQPIARFSENRTFFQKAVIFALMAMVPFLLCIGISTLVGCGLVFAAGVFYGLMALGRKADRNQMRQNASTMEHGGSTMGTVQLVSADELALANKN